MGAMMPQRTPRTRASNAAVAGLARKVRTPRLISATSRPNAVMAATVAPIALGHVRPPAECRDSSSRCPALNPMSEEPKKRKTIGKVERLSSVFRS